MEQKRDIIFEPKEPPALEREAQDQARLKEYESADLKSDISLFPEDIQKIIEKYIGGEELDPEEEKIFIKERNRWWSKKYSFPHNNKPLRAIVLKRKYENLEAQEIDDLQVRFTAAIKDNDKETLDRLKKIYEERFPDQLQVVTALFELPTFFEMQVWLDIHKQHKGWLKKIEYITEYKFLLANMIIQNKEHKEFLKAFWAVADEIDKEMKYGGLSKQLRLGVLSQVAVYKIFENLGRQPSLAHPKEDTYHMIDFWVDGDTVVQVKGGGPQKGPPQVLGAGLIDIAHLPVLAPRRRPEKKTSESLVFDEFERFKRKIIRYGAELGKTIKGYMVMIPYNQFDWITGEPSPELTEMIAKELSRISEERHDEASVLVEG